MTPRVQLVEAASVVRQPSSLWVVKYRHELGGAVERSFLTRGAALAFVRQCRLVPVHREVR